MTTTYRNFKKSLKFDFELFGFCAVRNVFGYSAGD